MEEFDADETRAVLGHVVGFLLPLVGPATLLLASRGRDRFARSHLVASTVVSAGWLVAAIAVISVDVGRLSIDEQDTSTAGLLGLLAVAGVVLLSIVLNIQRAKRRQLPFGWPRSS